jgi:hypothetical protein
MPTLGLLINTANFIESTAWQTQRQKLQNHDEKFPVRCLDCQVCTSLQRKASCHYITPQHIENEDALRPTALLLSPFHSTMHPSI